MIAVYGMSDILPNICYYDNNDYNFTKPYSEETAKVIDSEVLKMVNEQYARAKALLEEHREGHNELADLLMQREVIFAEDVERIFGKRPWASRAEEIIESNEKINQNTELARADESSLSVCRAEGASIEDQNQNQNENENKA